MLNHFIVVGRIVEFKEIDENRTLVLVIVPRSFKNKDGEYETDLITCELNNMISTNTSKYCKEGDIIGLKGRIETEKEGLKLVAEKVTFLPSNKEEENK